MNTLFLVVLLAINACKSDDETAPIYTAPTMDTKEVSYLALGDSYTIGTSLANDSARYPVQLAARLNRDGIECNDPLIIAQNGWTTGNLIASTDNFQPDSAYSLVSLLIGVNNQYQGRSIEEYTDQFTLLLNRAIQYAGNDTSHVFVISIPDYGVTPFGMNSPNAANISGQIDEFNAVALNIAQEHGVTFYNITDISRQAANDPSLIASDGLHPSGKMYELWIDAYYEDIKMMIP